MGGADRKWSKQRILEALGRGHKGRRMKVWEGGAGNGIQRDVQRSLTEGRGNGNDRRGCMEKGEGETSYST